MTPTTTQERKQAREAIQFHYDVGNRFYKLWLDARMIYSCAMWVEGAYDSDLETAQLRKLDFHVEQAGAATAHRILDVGCGWGGLLARCLERNPNLERGVGLTLSAEQASFCRDTLQPAVIDCRLEDWRDHRAEAPYDGIISIGAFEHFAAPGDSRETRIAKYKAFFDFCRANLSRGGHLSLQTIAYLKMRREDASAFMNTEIFPDSDLPYLEEIVTAAAGSLEILAVRNDRLDYAHTCNLWARRLKTNRTAAVEVSGEATVRKFERYLLEGSVGFFQGKLSLLRIKARGL
jgi:cyclopropane-fatty-acyl-phospholipid synthase